MRIALTILLGIFVCWLSGCTTARLTKRQVTEIAKAKVLIDGANLDGYEAPKVAFDSETKLWSFVFDEKPPGVPGGYLFIQVDDRSGKAECVPSL